MLNDLDSADEITKQVTHLLRAAEAKGRLPTPLDDIVAAAQLVQTDEIVVSESMIKRAPEGIRELLRSAGRKITGVLDRRERVIQIAPDSSEGRKRFVTSHEVAHHIFPWQADLAVLGDNQQTLSPQVIDMFEREANQGAAEILFQQNLLEIIARDHPIAISTPVELSSMFGASIHATFRRWVESIDAVACGLVLDVRLTNGHRQRYEQLLTAQWRQQFGLEGFPTALATALFPFATHDPTDGTFHLVDGSRTLVELQYETFETPYRRFALIWLSKRQGFVARHRRRPSFVSEAR